MNKKIFISGTSGIGKTTLAMYLATKHQIPFIQGSSTVLWPKYNISNHSELLEMGIRDPYRGLRFQYDLLEVRKELTQGVQTFVTDRSPIDNAVYFLFQNSPYLDEDDTLKYLFQCATTFREIIGEDINQLKVMYLTRNFLPFDKMPNVVNDSKRITNGYFQDMIDHLFRMVFDDNLVKVLGGTKNLIEDEFKFIKIRDYNLETRKAIADNFINHNPTWLDRIFL